MASVAPSIPFDPAAPPHFAAGSGGHKKRRRPCPRDMSPHLRAIGQLSATVDGPLDEEEEQPLESERAPSRKRHRPSYIYGNYHRLVLSTLR